MKQPRQLRGDRGRTRIKERDIIMLAWMAEQYCMRLDHVQILGGWLSQEKQGQEPLAMMTAYRLVQRWQKAGWINCQKILGAQPMWLWPTAKGIDLARLTYPYYKPSASRLEHMHAVNNVRLWIEDKMRQGVHLPYEPIDWVSEREVNRERRFQGKKHIVDGKLILEGEAVGIEVELRLKSKARYESILKELQEEYQDIWYFAAAAIVPDLQRIMDKADPQQETFTIYSLDEAYNIVDQVR